MQRSTARLWASRCYPWNTGTALGLCGAPARIPYLNHEYQYRARAERTYTCQRKLGTGVRFILPASISQSSSETPALVLFYFTTGPCIVGGHFAKLIRLLSCLFIPCKDPRPVYGRLGAISGTKAVRWGSAVCWCAYHISSRAYANTYASCAVVVYLPKEPWACIHDKYPRKPTLSSSLSVAICSPTSFFLIVPQSRKTPQPILWLVFILCEDPHPVYGRLGAIPGPRAVRSRILRPCARIPHPISRSHSAHMQRARLV